MSDRRQLRDRIEALQSELARVRQHMDKLRAQHAKERTGLQAQLQEAQAAIRKLTARAEAAEAARAGAKSAPPQVQQLKQDSPPGGQAQGTDVLAPQPRQSTALVALASPPRDPDDVEALIARLCGLSPLDVRLRLRGGPPTPLVRAPTPDAEAMRLALRTQGLTAVALPLPPRASWSRPVVANFTLGPAALLARLEGGAACEVPYPSLALLMLTRRSSARLVMREEVEIDNRGRMRVRQEETYPVKEEHGLWLFAAPEVRLTFNVRTDFAGLGALLGLTTADNLRRLAEALSELGRTAILDDRLVRGVPVPSMLVPEGDAQEVLAELLWQCVRDYP